MNAIVNLKFGNSPKNRAPQFDVMTEYNLLRRVYQTKVSDLKDAASRAQHSLSRRSHAGFNRIFHSFSQEVA